MDTGGVENRKARSAPSTLGNTSHYELASVTYRRSPKTVRLYSDILRFFGNCPDIGCHSKGLSLLPIDSRRTYAPPCSRQNPRYGGLSYTPHQNVHLPPQAMECHISRPDAFFFSWVIPTKAAIATCVDNSSCGAYVKLRIGNGKASCRVLRMPPHGNMAVSDLPLYLRDTIKRKPKALRRQAGTLETKGV